MMVSNAGIVIIFSLVSASLQLEYRIESLHFVKICIFVQLMYTCFSNEFSQIICILDNNEILP